MHSIKFRERHLVGQSVTAVRDASLWSRYFRMSKHVKPGWFKKAVVGLVMTVELKVGVVAYA